MDLDEPPSTPPPRPPLVDAGAFHACSFPSWYPSFEPVTIKSVVVPLPPGFVVYLRQGGSVFLPPPPPGADLDADDPRFVRPTAGEDAWDHGGPSVQVLPGVWDRVRRCCGCLERACLLQLTCW